jgi:hypothetical protein
LTTKSVLIQAPTQQVFLPRTPVTVPLIETQDTKGSIEYAISVASYRCVVADPGMAILCGSQHVGCSPGFLSGPGQGRWRNQQEADGRKRYRV